MDNLRYYAALLLLMLMPGGLLYWFSIHPFIGFWRRVGPRATLIIHFVFLAALAGVMFLLRARLLSVEFGAEPVLIVIGIVLLAASVVLRMQISRHLTRKILSGMAELAPGAYKAPLLTEGLYARVRHPRYLQIMIAVLGWALIGNYLSGYVIFAASVVMLRLVIAMEEKELRARFGSAWDDYCARVPRLVPAWSRREKAR